jgi:hypothetical protein
MNFKFDPLFDLDYKFELDPLFNLNSKFDINTFIESIKF